MLYIFGGFFVVVVVVLILFEMPISYYIAFKGRSAFTRILTVV